MAVSRDEPRHGAAHVDTDAAMHFNATEGLQSVPCRPPQHVTGSAFADRLARWLGYHGDHTSLSIRTTDGVDGSREASSAVLDQPEHGPPRDTEHDRRRHPRHRARWPARCIDRTGAGWSCWVADRSSGGLGLDGCPPLEVDQVIDVTLDQIGSFACRVAWSSGRRCGVEFLLMPDELSSADVERLVGLLSAPRVSSSS